MAQPPPTPLGDGEGAEPYFRTFIQEGLRSSLNFGWELVLQVGGIFFRWDSKTSCIKNSEYKSQAKKKKNDSNCNFYNFSLLVPYPNKFVVVCICIIILHGIYNPQPTNIFYCGGLIFFFHILQLGAGNISNFLGTFCIGGP